MNEDLPTHKRLAWIEERLDRIEKNQARIGKNQADIIARLEELEVSDDMLDGGRGGLHEGGREAVHVRDDISFSDGFEVVLTKDVEWTGEEMDELVERFGGCP